MDESSYRIQEEKLIREDIKAYLHRHETKDLLRFLTCGSVDDGKSTLIGRVLYDSHMIYEDQLEKVAKDSKVYGTTDDAFDPALLTDGLKAEREQGITIDVAYRYFSTDKRKFIIADCPGHEQYTRNMATGASTCNLAVILIDARHGVITQTKRHSFICSLLGIKHVMVAVNKMDLVDWSQDVYRQIVDDYNAFVGRLNFSDIHFIPMSALKGDNVVERGDHLTWYDGSTFLHHLENVNISTDRNLIDMRFPVQYVLRPNLDFRGFSGTLASGVVRVGDEVASLPSRQQSKVKAIYGPDGEQQEAFCPQAITVTLTDEIDVSRGNMLVPVKNIPHIGNEFEAMVVWMHEKAAQTGQSYEIKHTSSMVPGVLTDIRYKVDVNTMKRDKGDEQENSAASLELNEIGRCHITLHRPIAFDAYERNSATGAFIIIDRLTNATVGAGMIVDRVVSRPGHQKGPVSQNIDKNESLVSAADRTQRMGGEASTLWLTGLTGAGKTTLAYALERRLFEMGRCAYVIDGENLRLGLNRDLGFSAQDRRENIRRAAELARAMNEAGLIAICALLSPAQEDRELARDIIGAGHFAEVYLSAPLEVCRQRDASGIYDKADSGQVHNFTGVTSSYQAPVSPDLVLPTHEWDVEACVKALLGSLDR